MSDAGRLTCPRCGRPKPPGAAEGSCVPCFRSSRRRERARRARRQAAIAAAVAVVLIGGLWFGRGRGRDRAAAPRPVVEAPPIERERGPTPTDMLKLPGSPSPVLESNNEPLPVPETPYELVAPFEELREKARRSANPAEAAFWVGRMMMRRGEYYHAEEAFREALRLRPGFPEAHLLLGRMSREDRPDEAIAEYKAAIRADPDFWPAYVELVDLLRVLERLEDWVVWKRREFDRRASVASAPPSAAEILTLKGHEKEVLATATYSPDGRRILTASGDGTARIWDAATGAAVLTIRGTGAPLYGASYSPDGSRVLTFGLDTSARVWDARSGAAVLTLAGPGSALILSACYSRDGSRILTASLRTAATVWDARSGAAILTIDKGSAGLLSASFSPDGRRIATLNYESEMQVRILDAGSGAPLLVIKETRGVHAARFSPDGSRIVLATGDGAASVRDAASGAVVLELRGHEGKAVAAAAYSPDGRQIVTVGGDATAQVWDARSGAALRTLIGHTEGPVAAAYSPDGRRIVTAGLEGTAKVWVAPP